MNCRSAVITSLVVLLQLAGCAGQRPAAGELHGLLPTPLLLLGEQHDAPEHQRLQRKTLERITREGELAALVLEMVEHGHDTRGLGRDASETQVRAALAWSEAVNTGAWSWASYGPLVMAAVRAGVPVVGGNLPRDRMKEAMGDASLDAVLSADGLRAQQENIREGHCDLLPEGQILPMTRIQLARDREMARTAQQALRPGQTVLLVAGNQHVRRDIGIPRHLPADQAMQVVVSRTGTQDAGDDKPLDAADHVWTTAPVPPRDHCAELKQQMARP